MNKKHLLIMMACLAPLAVLGVAWLLGAPVSTLFIIAMVVICPLSHLLMMGGHSGHGAHRSKTAADPSEVNKPVGPEGSI